jgi:hypothetical protein
MSHGHPWWHTGSLLHERAFSQLSSCWRATVVDMAAAELPARVASGPRAVAGHAVGGHMCDSPPRSSRAAHPPPASHRSAFSPRRSRPRPLLCSVPGKKGRHGVPPFLRMTGGPNSVAGPPWRCNGWQNMGTESGAPSDFNRVE